MQSHDIFFGTIFFAVFFLCMYVWQQGRAESILSQWAIQNNLKIVSRSRKWLLRGPYSFTANEGQLVYYITVQYPDGHKRSGYACIGGMLFGILSNHVDVNWND